MTSHAGPQIQSNLVGGRSFTFSCFANSQEVLAVPPKDETLKEETIRALQVTKGGNNSYKPFIHWAQIAAGRVVSIFLRVFVYGGFVCVCVCVCV